ncbi:hypothetical protein CK203_039110 [Vitis vinifera]|uniref:Retrotransposon gag domain-containing protein n=1 Tax=Vitis vinifera TaxID=29760 RepID=A0A438IFR4_VITVI|nr:hypothetical protein CK203_039110 [Vitis vinifera]
MPRDVHTSLHYGPHLAKAPPKSLPNQASEHPSTCKGFFGNRELPFFKELPTKLLKPLSRECLSRSAVTSGHSKGSMSGSNVEETSEQTRGRETEPTARGRGRKDKSRDAVANMEARLAKVELAMADTREGLDLIEQGMEKGLEDLREQIQDLRERVLVSQVQPVSHEEFVSFQGKVLSMLASMESRIEALATRMESRDQEVRQELAIYKAAVSARVMATQEASRVEVPKPHRFSGKRDAKELDNFLWHMERYFEAIALTDEAAKVCRYGEGICHHRDVGGFQEGDQKAVLPRGLAYLARKNMRRLKHTGSIRDYVKEFSSLMLEIPNMTQEELLFNFMDNLQGWAEQELRRRGIQDLATAMAVAESLTDYRRGDSSKIESLEDSHAMGGGDEVPRDHNAPKKGSDKTPNVQEGRGKAERKEFTPKIKCFLCDGPHWARDCPKRKALSAMIEEREQEDEAHMGSMQLLSALQFNPKPSTPKTSLLAGVQVKEEKGERAEVARTHMEEVTKGKVNSMGKKKQHSKHQKRTGLHPLEASREKEVKNILAERVTRRQGVPPVVEYLVRWKGLPKRRDVDGIGGGECHRMLQMTLPMGYIGGGKLLETPGAIYTKPLVGRVWKVLEMPRDVHTSLHYGGRLERSPRLSRDF